MSVHGRSAQLEEPGIRRAVPDADARVLTARCDEIGVEGDVLYPVGVPVERVGGSVVELRVINVPREDPLVVGGRDKHRGVELQSLNGTAVISSDITAFGAWEEVGGVGGL